MVGLCRSNTRFCHSNLCNVNDHGDTRPVGVKRTLAADMALLSSLLCRNLLGGLSIDPLPLVDSLYDILN